MKTLLLPIVLCLSLSAQSQVPLENLGHNNTSVLISNEGTVFSDVNNATPGYEVPNGSGLNAIYSTEFWFAAKDTFGTIYTSLGGHPQQGHDVFPGPYAGIYDSTYHARWGDAMWTICQAQIDAYRLWWECDNGITPPADCANVVPPSASDLALLYSWPAHGNVANGEYYWMAPFWDYDSDGSYDPSSGDYPLIKGCCATYMIQNDHGGVHTQTGTGPIGLEIHTMFYQYKTWNYLDDATFVEVMVRNMNPVYYTDFAYGIRVDADLGFSGDDYYGCDSTTNMMYFYNGDNDDDANYGIDPPAIGVVALNEPMYASTTGSIGFSTAAIWNVMNGLESLGTPIMHPDGYATTYTYSEDPNNVGGWSQYATGSSATDARGLMTSNHGSLDGYIFNFNAPEEVKQTYAILYARNGDHLQNVSQLLLDAAEVKVFHDTDSDVPCEGWWWSVDELDGADFNVYPNPASNQVNVTNDFGLNMDITLLNIEGKVVYKNASSGTSSFIDVSDLNAGIYLIQITSDAGSVVKRLVIN